MQTHERARRVDGGILLFDDERHLSSLQPFLNACNINLHMPAWDTAHFLHCIVVCITQHTTSGKLGDAVKRKLSCLNSSPHSATYTSATQHLWWCLCECVNNCLSLCASMTTLCTYKCNNLKLSALRSRLRHEKSHYLALAKPPEPIWYDECAISFVSTQPVNYNLYQ